jgi:hypothetical protein
MSPEDDAAPLCGVINQDLVFHENTEGPFRAIAERSRDRDLTRLAIAVGRQAIARPVQAEIAVRGNQIEMQQLTQKRRLHLEQLLSDRVAVFARGARDLRIAIHGTKQAMPCLAVRVLPQPIELGLREELTDLHDTALGKPVLDS